MFFFEGVKVLHKTALALISLLFLRPDVRKECTEYVNRVLLTFLITLTIIIIFIPCFVCVLYSNDDDYCIFQIFSADKKVT